jgi:hypothetical protein
MGKERNGHKGVVSEEDIWTGARQTHQKQPFLTFQVGPFVNHACGSSIEYVSELMYAASDADDDVSMPET